MFSYWGGLHEAVGQPLESNYWLCDKIIMWQFSRLDYCGFLV